MKIEPQIYVIGSVEAVEFYKRAFNGTLGFYVKNEDGTYANADIMIGDVAVLALCEDKKYTSHENSAPVMQFNIYDMGTEEAVLNAYQVLQEDCVRNDSPNGPEAVPWSSCCFGLVDKYNIFWWIAI